MLRGNDGRHVGANPDIRSWERDDEDAPQNPGTADDEGTEKMVRKVPDQNGYEAFRSLVLRYGSRDAHGETTLLIKVMNFNFGDIDAKFEEFNLLIKGHDDISGRDNIPDTIKRAIIEARAPEPLRTHLHLNSQSYTTFLEMRQPINQYLKSAQGFQTNGAR